MVLVGGGYEFDGREIAPLDERAVAEAARDWVRKGLRSAAITSVFSPMNGEMERRAAEIIGNEAPDMSISLSCQLGQFGLLPRENSTIINASLSELAVRVVAAFRKALETLSLNVPLFISQNDGTLMRVEDVDMTEFVGRMNKSQYDQEEFERCRAAAEQAIAEPYPDGPDAVLDVYTDADAPRPWTRADHPDPALA